MPQPTEPTDPTGPAGTTSPTPDHVVTDDLVEEVSIDGMCGVY